MLLSDNLSAYAFLCEKLQKNGVLKPAVNDVRFRDTGPNNIPATGNFRDHTASDKFRLDRLVDLVA